MDEPGGAAALVGGAADLDVAGLRGRPPGRGRYVLRMQDDASGALHVVAGEYREIERPRRLVYTWAWQGDDGPHPGRESVVTVEFHADGDGTTVVLEHSGLPDELSRERHARGWCGTFDNLEGRVFGGAGER